MPPFASSQNKLAKQIGVSSGTITNWRRQKWAPQLGEEGWDVAEWLEIKRRVKSGELDVTPYKSRGGRGRPKKSRQGKAPAKKAPAANPLPGGPPPDQPAREPEPLTEEEAGAVEALSTSKDPLEIAEAMAALAAAELARARTNGEAMTRANVGALKQALGELRLTKEAVAEARAKTGHLLPKSVVLATVGRLGRLMLQGVEQWSADVATKVQLWAASEDFRDQPASVQRALVQDWARASQRDLREAVVGQLDQIVTECRGGAA